MQPARPPISHRRDLYDAALRMMRAKVEGLRLDDGEEEFESLTVHDLSNGDCSMSLSSVNDTKNRYTNVLPFNMNVVPLGGSGYINASYCRASIAPHIPWTSIATQGPLPVTVKDFWQMVWEQGSEVIVMLGKCTERRRPKCAEYFPEHKGAVESCGSFLIENQDTEVLPDGIILRTLCVTDTTSKQRKEMRLVHHYQYVDWPDFGVPATTAPLRCLSWRLGHAAGRRFPPVIHCSAGIGRTGTFSVVDVLLWRLYDISTMEDVPAALDVFATVELLRQQRAGMVQTKEQYLFCFLALQDELEEICAGTASG
mmetsp:Transcript_29165/g.93156  ORF Transcript_29165/g.93156 Transcript_29165/m.93156 type:complete len:312 (-) Transcript_29165:180-1115(-)